MAHVENEPASVGRSRRRNGRPTLASPFYSRAYGGYTIEQAQFAVSQLNGIKGKIILDPMAGQGFALARLAYQEAQVWLGDINPALCLLASLRMPSMVERHEELRRWVDSKLKHLLPAVAESGRAGFVADWIAPSVRQELEIYRKIFQLNVNPFVDRSSFWRLPLRHRFAASLPILAARELTCFRDTDNKTWTKPGGLQRETHIFGPISRALLVWNQYAEEVKAATPRLALGEIFVQRMDTERANFGSAPKADLIITSPPYANRLDYTRMWASESQVAAALWDADVRDIQTRQIGSNVVSGADLTASELAFLPKSITAALDAIRDDLDSHASKRYYYPFFRRYALSLSRAILALATQVKRDGVLVIFVRDTVRKDVLFPTGLLVEELLTGSGFHLKARERRIVKRHVGLLRKGSATGLYGIGQQEWWLVFCR